MMGECDDLTGNKIRKSSRTRLNVYGKMSQIMVGDITDDGRVYYTNCLKKIELMRDLNSTEKMELHQSLNRGWTLKAHFLSTEIDLRYINN